MVFFDFLGRAVGLSKQHVFTLNRDSDFFEGKDWTGSRTKLTPVTSEDGVVYKSREYRRALSPFYGKVRIRSRL